VARRGLSFATSFALVGFNCLAEVETAKGVLSHLLDAARGGVSTTETPQKNSAKRVAGKLQAPCPARMVGAQQFLT